MEKVQANALLAFCPSLKGFLNQRDPLNQPSYLNSECRVTMLYPADDGRLNFEGHYSDGELLVTGCVDVGLFTDLTYALCPMDQWASVRARLAEEDPE